MSEVAKSWISGLGFYEPGRPIEELAREMGLKNVSEIIKLASNENSLGPSPKAVAAMRTAAARMHLYPDGGAFYLREAIAKKLGVKKEQVIAGNGSNELIVFLGHAYLERGTNIVMSDRAFVVYKLVAAMYEADVIAVPMDGFTHDLDAMLAAITPETRIVFIANPNNPTGTVVSKGAIKSFMAKVPDHVAVVFDEAYIELLAPEDQPDTLHYIGKRSDTYILRTFSKTYGLAGLRIGYAVAAEDDVQLLHRVRQPFNANAMAQAAALAALDDDDHVRDTRKMTVDGLHYLVGEFEEAGLEYVPSVANFMLVKVGAGRQVFEELQKRRIIVRPMDGYGLPEYVRVSVGTASQNKMLVKHMNALISEGKVTP